MADRQRTIGRREVLGSLGTAGAVALAGCSSGDTGSGDTGSGDTGNGDTGNGDTGNGDTGGNETVKAAFVYISEVGDLGWSWAHNRARKIIDDKYDWLTTEYTEAVPPSDSKRVFEQYAESDTDIIFGTTFGYMDPMYNVAKRYPDTLFEHATGYKTRENMGRYMGRIYQCRYVLGQACGMVTESNKIGYLAPFPIPEVVRSVNSNALGTKSVNPDATYHVIWTNAWFGPQVSKKAANTLIDNGCDVIVSEQDSPAPVKVANEHDVWACGYDAPMGRFGGENYLNSPIWHWEKFYAPTCKAVRDGTWKSDFFWGNMQTGVPLLDEWGPKVPQSVKNKAASTKQKIYEAENNRKVVWDDSIFGDKGDKFLFQKMNKFVKNVAGEVPD